MFINAEDGRADAVAAFTGFELGVFLIEAFYGSGANAALVSENTSGNTMAMELVDVFSERF